MIDRRFDPDLLPAVVAHRGASTTHPENTLDAFDAAVEAGADAIELDVRVTADGVGVVMHDAEVSRTTDGQGFVHELTFGQLKSLRIARPDAPPVEVPSLFEALEILSGRVGIDLEIKNIPGQPGFETEREQAVEVAVRELERSAFAGAVLVSSFNPRSIERCRMTAPELPTGLLSTEPLPAGDALRIARDAGHGWVLPSVSSLLAAGPGLVAEAHLGGVLVGTWTVDHRETIAQLLAWGVDAIAANDPAEAVCVRDAWRLSKGS